MASLHFITRIHYVSALHIGTRSVSNCLWLYLVFNNYLYVFIFLISSAVVHSRRSTRSTDGSDAVQRMLIIFSRFEDFLHAWK